MNAGRLEGKRPEAREITANQPRGAASIRPLGPTLTHCRHIAIDDADDDDTHQTEDGSPHVSGSIDRNLAAAYLQVSDVPDFGAPTSDMGQGHASREPTAKARGPVPSGIRCESAGVVPGFIIRSGDSADSFGLISGRVAVTVRGRIWKVFERRAVQVLQEPQSV